MKKTSLYFSFLIMGILIVIMSVATWDGYFDGTDHSLNVFYHSDWFVLLWILLFAAGGCSLFFFKVYRKLPVFFLHLSLMLILAGAFVSHVSGKTGSMHLIKGEDCDFYTSENGGGKPSLPFYIRLERFEVRYYKGTESPSDYVSTVRIKDKGNYKVFRKEISMNNILKYKDYRIYQSSFDPDFSGSYLMLNYDKYGVGISYAGYFLLFLSMAFVLIDKRGRFRELLRNNLEKF